MEWVKHKFKTIAIALSVIAIATAGYAVDQTFSVAMRILTTLAVTVDTNLIFPDTESLASAQTITVSPGATGAATFTISGEPSETITVSVVETSITMSDGTNSFTVDSFTVDGASCTGGAGTLDGSGTLTTCEVGATANVGANQVAASYSGTATLQVIYN